MWWYIHCYEQSFRPYWVQTSSNELIRQLLFENPLGIREEVEKLLRGGCIEKPIEDNIVFRDLKIEKQAIWSFLLFTGYLKATRLYDHQYRTWAELCVPNQEVLRDFYNLTGVWTEHQLGGSLSEDLLNALLQGDALSIQNLLSDILQTSASYHDLESKTPERFYYAFLLGVLVHYGNQYEIRSNREAGHGRYDLVIIPKDSGRPAVVLEIKVLRDELSPERALGQALEQIQTKNYATELRARKLSAIHGIGLVFASKRAFAQGIRLDQVEKTSS